MFPYTLLPDGHTLEPEDVVKPPAPPPEPEPEESSSTHSPHLDFGNPPPPQTQAPALGPFPTIPPGLHVPPPPTVQQPQQGQSGASDPYVDPAMQEYNDRQEQRLGINNADPDREPSRPAIPQHFGDSPFLDASGLVMPPPVTSEPPDIDEIKLGHAAEDHEFPIHPVDLEYLLAANFLDEISCVLISTQDSATLHDANEDHDTDDDTVRPVSPNASHDDHLLRFGRHTLGVRARGQDLAQNVMAHAVKRPPAVGRLGVATDAIEFAFHIIQGDPQEAFKVAVSSIASAAAAVAGTAAFGPLGGFIASTAVGIAVDFVLDSIPEAPDDLDLGMIDVPSYGVPVDSILLAEEWMGKGFDHLGWERYEDAKTAFVEAGIIHAGMVDSLRIAYAAISEFRLNAEKELEARYEEAVAAGSHTEDELRSRYDNALNALSTAQRELENRYEQASRKLSEAEAYYQYADELLQEADPFYSS